MYSEYTLLLNLITVLVFSHDRYPQPLRPYIIARVQQPRPTWTLRLAGTVVGSDRRRYATFNKKDRGRPRVGIVVADSEAGSTRFESTGSQTVEEP
jgi:hypothetical protein